jgi:cytochrome P450
MTNQLLRRADCEVDFDHHSPEYARDPAAAYRGAFEKCPVTWSSAHGGYWLVTGFEESFAALQDDALFSSADGVSIPPQLRKASPIDVDPPQHRLYRRALNKGTSPAAVRELAPSIIEWTREAMRKVASEGGGDLVTDVAAPVPAKAIMVMLGLKQDNWRRYAEVWHELFAHPTDKHSYDELAYIWDEIHEKVKERHENPTPDLIGRMWSTGLLDEVIKARSGGCPVAHGEVSRGFVSEGAAAEGPVEEGTHTAMTLLGAGVDTTTNLFSSVSLWLGEHPKVRTYLAGHMDDATVWDHAVDEFIRYFATAPALARTVTRDTEFFGHQLGQGDRILISFMAANRDPRVFDRPDELVLDRFPNRHMTFGVGIHRCLGSHLARLAFSLMLRELLVTLPDYEVLADQAEYYEDRANIAGWSKIPITCPVTGAVRQQVTTP